jgi:DNA-binding PadR family transcriptional regulator
MSARQGAARKTSTRSIRSPVYWSLLGLLIERADYGYGLVQRFDLEYGDVLPLSGGSTVYEALTALEMAGFIEEVTRRRRTARRQPTPDYRATPEGVRAYASWLRERVCTERLRSRAFARQLAVLESAPQLGLEILERYEQACLEDAQRLPAGPPPATSTPLAAALPAEQARLASEAELPWASYARARFTELVRAKK